MYICKYFKLHELVYPTLYKKYKSNPNYIWKIFNPSALITIDRIREFLDCPVVINNYKFKGNLRYCGLRPANCQVGSYLSDHKFGEAFDLHFLNNNSKHKVKTPEMLRLYMEDIGCFEKGFKLRTDNIAFPFILINSIEWIE